MQRYLGAGNQRLPLVVRLLFYHGQVTPYPYSLCWLDEFGDTELATELYVGEFPLVDVTVIPDDATPAYGYPGAVTETYPQRDLANLLEQRVTLLLAGYMLQVVDTAAPETFIRELAHWAPQHEEVFMTVAQKLELK
ncbi:Rpn family recombination-promoting nuclease/putative transposase [Serratia symbiotica]|nr:Rpn family recombination-promoting nuclease/putative transposase [Serratia symbiotica]